jgi:hypothetical protein
MEYHLVTNNGTEKILMANNFNTRILEITLSGFQAFLKPSTIPVSPITLIYGPNSAGKSAIYDAIDLLCRFFDSRGTSRSGNDWPFLDAASRRYAIARDWHQECEEKYGPDPLLLSVTFSCPGYCVFDPHLMTSGYLPFDLLNSLRTQESIIKASIGFLAPWDQSRLQLTFDLDGHELYRFNEGESVAFNTRHPIYGTEGAKLPQCSKGGANSSPVSLSTWAEIRGNISMNGPHEMSWEKLAKSINPDEKPLTNPLVWYEALNEFAHVHNLLLGQLVKTAFDACTFDIVEASRTIPEARHLTFALTDECDIADPGSLHFQLNSAARYAEVVRSAAALELIKTSKASSPEQLADGGALAVSINQTLADHLYTDKGYRLDVDLTKLVPESGTNRAKHKVPAWLVNLCLRDSSGRRLSFADVGSGIGYVLPAIVALWTTRRCFVQQPELHLHPALQTSLGDALIEAAKDMRTFLIETHSEHILLRILKRVRQTEADPARAGAYQIDPGSISIVYCEPRADGTTRAVTLKVTSEGDFIGRWPRGFFAERDGELFDE